MGKAEAARDLRRETKRTLGNQLKEFAHDQHRRLEEVEKSVLAANDRVNEERGRRLKMADEQRAYVDQGDGRSLFARTVTSRGFFGRLKWLVFGR